MRGFAITDGKMQHDAQPGIVILQSDRGSVQACHRGNQAEAQTVAWCRTAGFHPIEVAEDIFTFVGRNTWTAIGYDQAGRATAMLQVDQNVPTFRCVFDGVIQQIGDGLKQQVAVAGGDCDWRQIGPNLLAALLGEWFV